MKKYILPIIITIIALLIGMYSLFLYIHKYSTYKDFDYTPNYNEVIYYKLNGLSTYYINALNNEYLTWKRARNSKEISKKYIESIVKIDAEDLNNKYCDLMEKKSTEENVLKCIDTYYQEKGLYDLLQVEYDKIYEINKHASNNVVRQKAISILYLLEDLKHLSIGNNQSIEKFYEKYTAIVNDLENDLDDMKKKLYQ